MQSVYHLFRLHALELELNFDTPYNFARWTGLNRPCKHDRPRSIVLPASERCSRRFVEGRHAFKARQPRHLARCVELKLWSRDLGKDTKRDRAVVLPMRYREMRSADSSQPLSHRLWMLKTTHLPHLEQKCLSTLLPLSVAESTYVEISLCGSRISTLSLVVERLLSPLVPVDLRQLSQ
jgi:hypothetical protein